MNIKDTTAKIIKEALEQKIQSGTKKERKEAMAALSDLEEYLGTQIPGLHQRFRVFEKSASEAGNDYAGTLNNMHFRLLDEVTEDLPEDLAPGEEEALGRLLLEAFINSLLVSLEEFGFLEKGDIVLAANLAVNDYRSTADTPDTEPEEIALIVEDLKKSAISNKKHAFALIDEIPVVCDEQGVVHVGFLTPDEFAQGSQPDIELISENYEKYHAHFDHVATNISRITFGLFHFFSAAMLSVEAIQSSKLIKLPDFLLESSDHGFSGLKPKACAAVLVETSEQEAVCMSLLLIDKEGHVAEQKNVFPLGWYKRPDNLDPEDPQREYKFRMALEGLCEKFVANEGCEFIKCHSERLSVCTSHLTLNVAGMPLDDNDTVPSGGPTLH